MTIALEIPYDFVDHWDKDCFEESLRRLSADASRCKGCSGNYEAELCDMLIMAFKNAHEFLTCTDCEHSHRKSDLSLYCDMGFNSGFVNDECYCSKARIKEGCK